MRRKRKADSHVGFLADVSGRRAGAVIESGCSYLRTSKNSIFGPQAFIPKIEPATFVVVDSFSDSSINIMLYCFTKTTDWGEWLNVKPALALKAKEIVERNGASFALPSTLLYVEQ